MGITAILQALPHGTAAAMLAVTAVVGYLLGCCNGAVMVSCGILHDDIRKHGSGNAGLTNFKRVFGWRLAPLVILSDMLKIVLSVVFANILFMHFMGGVPVFVHYWAGFFGVCGHIFPCTFQFQGGKGILSGGTLCLCLIADDWHVAAWAWGLFLLAVVLTRWVSLGSCLAAVGFAASSAVCFPVPSIAVPCIVIAVLVLWKHRANIGRILRGEESRFSFHGKKEVS